MSTTNEVGKMATSNGERLHQWSKNDYYGWRMDAPLAWEMMASVNNGYTRQKSVVVDCEQRLEDGDIDARG